MYSHPFVKIIKTDDNSFVIEVEEKIKVKKKKSELAFTEYRTRHYVAENVNKLFKKLKEIIPNLKSANDEYVEAFNEATGG